jgi:hypothetical protein
MVAHDGVVSSNNKEPKGVLTLVQVMYWRTSRRQPADLFLSWTFSLSDLYCIRRYMSLVDGLS